MRAPTRAAADRRHVNGWHGCLNAKHESAGDRSPRHPVSDRPGTRQGPDNRGTLRGLWPPHDDPLRTLDPHRAGLEIAATRRTGGIWRVGQHSRDEMLVTRISQPACANRSQASACGPSRNTHQEFKWTSSHFVATRSQRLTQRFELLETECLWPMYAVFYVVLDWS